MQHFPPLSVRDIYNHQQKSATVILKPHNILQSLGFDIPEEGLEINDDDAFLYIKILALMGETIDIDSIDDETMFQAHLALSGLVAARRGEEIAQPTNDSIPRFRALCEVVVNDVLKFRQKK